VGMLVGIASSLTLLAMTKEANAPRNDRRRGLSI